MAYSFLEECHGGVRMSIDGSNVHERASIARALIDGGLELLCQEGHNAGGWRRMVGFGSDWFGLVSIVSIDL